MPKSKHRKKFYKKKKHFNRNLNTLRTIKLQNERTNRISKKI